MTRNKTGGRKAGTPNKVTAELRERVQNIINDNYSDEAIEQMLSGMDDKDKLSFFTKLLEFALPKMKSTELTTDNSDMTIIVKPPTRPLN